MHIRHKEIERNFSNVLFNKWGNFFSQIQCAISRKFYCFIWKPIEWVIEVKSALADEKCVSRYMRLFQRLNKALRMANQSFVFRIAFQCFESRIYNGYYIFFCFGKYINFTKGMQFYWFKFIMQIYWFKFIMEIYLCDRLFI